MTQPATPVARAGPPPPPPRREPAERGRLHISSLAMRRIAEHVANHSPGTTASASTARRRPAGAQSASARVRTDGELVEVELDVALVYPQPIRETAAELRKRIAAEINRLTGRQVRTVTVTVVALLPERKPRVG
jgi:uncharacterized alkaline shock family protein YloU